MAFEEKQIGRKPDAQDRPSQMDTSAPASFPFPSSLPAHLTSLEFNLPGIPPRQIQEFLEYIHSSPTCLKENGEAMRYFHLVDRWTAYLHAHLPEAEASEPWRTAYAHFAQRANWMSLYFADAALRPLYDRRGDIMEAALRAMRYPIEYKFGSQPAKRNKIKIGILNAHFSESAETRATLPVFAYLDPERFEVILYALHLTDQPLEKFCASRAAGLVRLPESASAQIPFLRREDLDILFYGTNLTAVMHPLVLLALHRLARVQVTSFCCPVTTGFRHMDYFVAGTLTESASDPAERYRERLILLEGSGICFDLAQRPPVSGFSTSRENLGIPRSAPIFISGANFFKIIPELRETWAGILAAVPGSHLVLYPFGPAWSASYAVQEFALSFQEICRQAGVSFSRVKLLKPMASPCDLHAVLKLADVYLDSFPYSGATSLLDPLEVGLPPVAKSGGVLRFSQAAALLHELGLPELVADGKDSYVHLAVLLAGDKALRKSLSERIAERMRKTPPFLDARAHSSRMGDLFEEFLRSWRP
jgi:predicted O-linked N-acetylglucosamine transferase (SPINDLY family)